MRPAAHRCPTFRRLIAILQRQTYGAGLAAIHPVPQALCLAVPRWLHPVPHDAMQRDLLPIGVIPSNFNLNLCYTTITLAVQAVLSASLLQLKL